MAMRKKQECSDPHAQEKQKQRISKRMPMCHTTHSFEWCWNGKKTTITCNKVGSVRNSLRRSSQFRQQEDKNKHKELVVEKNGRPIPSHYPCALIQPEDRIGVKFVKASGPKQPMPPLRSGLKSLNQLVEFNVVTKGGKNITKIIQNTALRTYPEVTVYGFKGEKVKHALVRDGRFSQNIFDKTCALTGANTNVELSNLVDHLGGKTFQIVMLNKSSPPASQSSSFEDSFKTDDSFSSDLDDNGDTYSFSESENRPIPIKQEIHEYLHVIPDSQELRSQLSSQVSRYRDRAPTEGNNVYNLCLEFGRREGAFPKRAMKKVMTSSDAVCQLRIGGRPIGSGFLLFNTYVLTNFHVIKDVFDCSMNQLSQSITLHFSFDSLDQLSPGHEVQDVVAYEYHTESGQKHDWVLLSLMANSQLPSGLLAHFGFLPQSGSICIVGHPSGYEQMVDSMWIIPINSREQILTKHHTENMKAAEKAEVVQFLSSFASSVAMEMNNSRDLTYETCFYFGSSGSPVFDSNANVVAMHSGGYPYMEPSGQMQSFIEYGLPLSSILENLIVRLVLMKKLDVLKQLLQFRFNNQVFIFNNVKKLVNSRYYGLFKNVANNFNVSNDNVLKMFFVFILKNDSPVPMDTANT